ncbi:uncharacterized protein LOC132197468 [Neocloeon triangulifer]|uniref:uncharacterized protein LOC132197468 n=1 Tax=Neocloeon triangulifer TaxID=2078957 RepID=UPI00286F0237|nr:uncharacterized protein LOC132197468 [Neocloeon triangulifer]
MSAKFFCLALLTLVLSAQTGYAIKCFVCNSHTDKACMQDRPPESLEKDCTDAPDGATYTMCRKIVQHIDFEVNGLQPDHRVIRSCGYEASNYVDKCYQRAGFGGRQEVCSCTTGDMCNSAPGISSMSVMVTVAVAALARLFLY